MVATDLRFMGPALNNGPNPRERQAQASYSSLAAFQNGGPALLGKLQALGNCPVSGALAVAEVPGDLRGYCAVGVDPACIQ